MKKVLFVSNTFRHLWVCHIPYMNWLKQEGWQVDIVGAGKDFEFPNVDNIYRVDMERTPFSTKNFGAYDQLKKIIDREQYDLVYCHTPMGGVLARLASRQLRKAGKTKVIYVAHGFHFFKGASAVSWMVYYPVERYLSRYSDAVVTINQEDYDNANGVFSCPVYKIDGIGVEGERFFVASPEQKSELRKEFDLTNDDFVLTYIAEHNANKNQRFIIDNVAKILEKVPSLKVLLVGKGEMFESNVEYVKSLGLEDSVKLLGFRRDIPQIAALSDLVASASLREGLGINLVEGLLAGVPVIALDNRGHREIIKEGENGYIFAPNDNARFVELVQTLYSDKALYSKLAANSVTSAERFLLSNPLSQIANIFKKTLN